MDSFKEVMIDICRLQSEVAKANARLEKKFAYSALNSKPMRRYEGEYDEELRIHNKYERLSDE
jgi:hypothetical protein